MGLGLTETREVVVLGERGGDDAGEDGCYSVHPGCYTSGVIHETLHRPDEQGLGCHLWPEFCCLNHARRGVCRPRPRGPTSEAGLRVARGATVTPARVGVVGPTHKLSS